MTSAGHVQKLRDYCEALFYRPNLNLNWGQSDKQSKTTLQDNFFMRKFFGAKIIEKKLKVQDSLQQITELKSYCITSEKIFNLRKQSNRSVKKFYAYEHFGENELRELLYDLPHSRASSHIVHSLRITEALHLQKKLVVAKRWIRLFATLAATSGAVPSALPLPLVVTVSLRKILGTVLKESGEELLQSNLFAVLLDCYNISSFQWEEFWPASAPRTLNTEQKEQNPEAFFPFARFVNNASTQAATQAALRRISQAATRALSKKNSGIWAKRLFSAAPALALAGNASIIYSRVYRSGLRLAKNCEQKWLHDFNSQDTDASEKTKRVTK